MTYQGCVPRTTPERKVGQEWWGEGGGEKTPGQGMSSDEASVHA